MTFITEILVDLQENFVGNFGPEFPSMFLFLTVFAQ